MTTPATTLTSRPTLKSLDPLSVFSYAVGIAIREAVIDGVLTMDQALRISDRADALKNALYDGKIVEVSKDGAGHIRDVEPDEEDEMPKEDFPFVHKAKTTLDI